MSRSVESSKPRPRYRHRSRWMTVAALIGHFVSRQRFFLAPLVIVLLLASLLLALTGGVSYVAPFVYTVF